jgi:hypothetical protein
MSKQKVYTLLEAYEIYSVLKSLKGITSSEFNYFVNSNYFKAEDVLKAVLKTQKDIEASLAPFNSEKQTLILKFCTKDKAGDPIAVPVSDTPGVIQYSIPEENKVEYAKALQELKKKHAKLITGSEKQLQDLDKILLRPAPEFKPETISNSFVPATLDVRQHRVIFPLITK